MTTALDSADSAARSRVEIDVGADRCAGLVGWSLWWRVALRAVLGAAWLFAVVGLGVALHHPAALALSAGGLAAALWAGGVVGASVWRLAASSPATEEVARRYGCRSAGGAAAVQRRSLRIVAPPADLGERVAGALRELSPRTQVVRLDRRHFVARCPRRCWHELGLEVEVGLDEQTDGSVVAAVEVRPCGYWTPFAPDPSVHPDGGRGILVAEELQRALRRRIEGR